MLPVLIGPDSSGSSYCLNWHIVFCWNTCRTKWRFSWWILSRHHLIITHISNVSIIEIFIIFILFTLSDSLTWILFCKSLTMTLLYNVSIEIVVHFICSISFLFDLVHDLKLWKFYILLRDIFFHSTTHLLSTTHLAHQWLLLTYHFLKGLHGGSWIVCRPGLQ